MRVQIVYFLIRGFVASSAEWFSPAQRVERFMLTPNSCIDCPLTFAIPDTF